MSAPNQWSKSKFGFPRTRLKITWIYRLRLLKQVSQILNKQKSKKEILKKVKATSKKIMEAIFKVKKVEKSIRFLNI